MNDVIVCDTQGTIFRGREGLYNNKYKFILAEETNQRVVNGTLADAMAGADVFIGVSAPQIVTEEMVRSMNRDAIIFAMANPVPEIWPDAAKKGGAVIVGTGGVIFQTRSITCLHFRVYSGERLMHVPHG